MPRFQPLQSLSCLIGVVSLTASLCQVCASHVYSSRLELPASFRSSIAWNHPSNSVYNYDVVTSRLYIYFFPRDGNFSNLCPLQRARSYNICTSLFITNIHYCLGYQTSCPPPPPNRACTRDGSSYSEPISTSEYFRVLPSTSEYFRVLPSTSEYFRVRVFPSTSEYFRVLPSTSEYFRVLPSTSEYFRVLPSTSEYFRFRLHALYFPFFCFLSTIWCVVFIVNKLLNLSRRKPPAGNGVDNLFELTWLALLNLYNMFCIRYGNFHKTESCTKKLDSIDHVYKTCVSKIIITIWFGDNVTVSHITGGIPQSWHPTIYS